MTGVCFCGIVRQEARVIERCLTAARFMIDYVSICDTGSTDKTVQLIEAWGKANNIPTVVHSVPWKNFGYNRTESLVRAYASFPQATYLLLLDADMVLMDRGFKKEQLKEDGYMITQTEQGSSYRNLRLVKNCYGWKSVGVTHEYTAPVEAKDMGVPGVHAFTAPLHRGGFQAGTLDTVWIDDRSDGGCKDDKLDRDAVLLIQGLKDEPGNSRYMFYLGNTYFAMHQYLDAIYWYERRIADTKNMFEEEAWYACYRVAQAYEKMKDYPRTVYWYMKAINRRPHRIEPYVCLAKHFIFSDPPHQYWTATLLIKEGLAQARRDVDLLFYEDKAYDYDGWYVLSIANTYIRGRELEGRAACQKVLASSAPADMKKHVKGIQDTYYA